MKIYGDEEKEPPIQTTQCCLPLKSVFECDWSEGDHWFLAINTKPKRNPRVRRRLFDRTEGPFSTSVERK